MRKTNNKTKWMERLEKKAEENNEAGMCQGEY